MQNSKMKYLLSCVLITLLSPLYGQVTDAKTQLSFQRGIAKYDSKELSTTGFVLNRETGSLPFVQLGLKHKLFDEYFVDASFRHASNAITYDGYTQIGIPITTRTQLQWQQASIALGMQRAWSDSDQLQWTLGLGQRHLDRDIKPTLGSLPLREVLHVTQLQLGAKWQKKIAQDSQWHLGILLQPALSQSLRVDSYGMYDPISLKLGKQTADRRIYTGLAHNFSPRWQVQLNWGLDIMKPQPSAQDVWKKNGVPAATVRYPGSQQRMSDLGLQLSAHF